MTARSTRRAAAGATVTLAAALALAPAAAADPTGADGTQERVPRPWTAVDDYVRVLVYWHHHPDWMPDVATCTVNPAQATP